MLLDRWIELQAKTLCVVKTSHFILSVPSTSTIKASSDGIAGRLEKGDVNQDDQVGSAFCLQMQQLTCSTSQQPRILKDACAWKGCSMRCCVR